MTSRVNVSALAREAGVSRQTIRARIERGLRGAALTARPTVRRPKRMLTYRGRTLSVLAWAKRLGLAEGTIWNRLRAGLTIARVLDHNDNRGPQASAMGERRLSVEVPCSAAQERRWRAEAKRRDLTMGELAHVALASLTRGHR